MYVCISVFFQNGYGISNIQVEVWFYTSYFRVPVVTSQFYYTSRNLENRGKSKTPNSVIKCLEKSAKSRREEPKAATDEIKSEKFDKSVVFQYKHKRTQDCMLICVLICAFIPGHTQKDFKDKQFKLK